jgi:hypothetical protein
MEAEMGDRPGCLAGLLKLTLLNWVYDFLQHNIGFGRRSCGGCGCGVIMLIIFIVLVCQIVTNTNWLKLW